MLPATDARVNRFWRGIFGESPSYQAGKVTRHRGPLDGYPGIYCVLRGQRALVSAPPEQLASVTEWRPSVPSVVDPTWWIDRLPGWSALGPSAHAFLDRTDRLALVSSRARVRVASPADLDHLRDAVTPAEWSESGFGEDDLAYAWVAVDDDDLPVAGANLTSFGDLPADVGVLSAVRGQGFATLVAATAARYAVEHHGIARWRALTTNLASRRIAERLGFEIDCLQLAVRPG